MKTEQSNTHGKISILDFPVQKSVKTSIRYDLRVSDILKKDDMLIDFINTPLPNDTES